ncbi:MAG: hypothetical protein ACT4QE_03275 [Anaerolineales bacterium]
MFDNLRQPVSDDSIEMRTTDGSARTVLGLKPSQLFIVSLMLFINIAFLGCFALIVFEKIALPIF